MKYCQNCSNQLLDAAILCPKCGTACPAQPIVNSAAYQAPLYQTYPYHQPIIDTESSSTANCALLFAFLSPFIGFICGLVGLYRTPKYTTRCIIAIIISVLRIILAFAIIGLELFMTLAGV